MKRVVSLIFCLLMSSCILSKDEYDPIISFPNSYTGPEPAVTSNHYNLNCYWEEFKDPILNQLVEDLLDGNFDVRIAVEKVFEIRANYEIARGKLFPQIDFDASWIRSRRSGTLFAEQFQGPLYQSLFTLGFDAVWELDIFGKLRNARDAAFYDFLASIENARDVYITILGDLIRLYAEVRALQAQIALNEKYIASQEMLFTLSDDRFNSGLVAQFEPKDLLARLDAKKAQLPLLKSALQQGIYGISFLLGKEPTAMEDLLAISYGIPDPVNKVPVGLPSDLLQRRPDIRRSQNELIASEARIKSAKAELFPSFSLVGSIGLQSNFLGDWFDSNSLFWRIGPGLTTPVFRGGQIRANIKATNSRQKQAALTYEKTVINAFKEVEDSLIAYFERNVREESLVDEFASNQRIYDLADNLFQGGLESLSPVLDALLRAYQSEEQLILNKRDLLIDLVALYKALGGGWECTYTP